MSYHFREHEKKLYIKSEADYYLRIRIGGEERGQDGLLYYRSQGPNDLTAKVWL